MRRLLVHLHRWAGLFTAGFLVVVGVTGSLLAFNVELERICAPQLFAKARPIEQRLDLATLAQQAELLLPQAQVLAINMNEPDQAYVVFSPRENPATKRPYELEYTEVFIDPWSGKILGRRNRGDLSEGIVNLMPFIYLLHYQLALGDVGMWVVGIVAICWSIDCFVALYLTFPFSLGGFWRRWRRAWAVKRPTSAFRLNFDVHRASGLWVWPLLFVFAWSGVMMTMRSFYSWPMHHLFPYSAPLPENASTAPKRNLDWRAALIRGQELMRQEAALNRFTFTELTNLGYDPSNNTYELEVRSSRDVFRRSPKGGGTSVIFSAESGALINLSMPTGQHLGDTIDSWLAGLHMARVFGLPFRIMVSVLGLIISTLSCTGVYIWWKKREARIFGLGRLSARREASFQSTKQVDQRSS